MNPHIKQEHTHTHTQREREFYKCQYRVLSLCLFISIFMYLEPNLTVLNINIFANFK